jgi:hypothetical protein
LLHLLVCLPRKSSWLKVNLKAIDCCIFIFYFWWQIQGICGSVQ